MRMQQQMRPVVPIPNSIISKPKGLKDYFSNIKQFTVPWREMILVFLLVFLAHPKVVKSLGKQLSPANPRLNVKIQTASIAIIAACVSVLYLCGDLVIQKIMISREKRVRFS